MGGKMRKPKIIKDGPRGFGLEVRVKRRFVAFAAQNV